MHAAEIGVVIPTWNSAKTLATTLLSLEQQVDARLRIVVADSGSTDGTLRLCSTAQIPTVYVPPGNMYRAVNAGARQLDTPWIAYLNSDDFVYRDTYARLVSRGETAGADVVYGNVDFVDADGRFLYSLQAARPGALRQLFGAFLFGFMPHAAVFRRRTFDALGGFDESFRHIADMDLFARACCAGQRFASVPYPSVAVFRIHADQLSRRERNVVRHELVQLQTRLGRKSRLAGGWAILEWQARNIRQYLLRWLRTGSFRRAV